MAATNSPRPGYGRHSDHSFMTRPKRESIQLDSGAARSFYDAAARMPDLSEEATFIPNSLGEHLLERTYLEDVVRPLVRALVKARMTYGVDGEFPNEPSQAYMDLEKLRRELERSTQRARNAEQERDDLARRLDLAGVPDASMRDRSDGYADRSSRAESITTASRSYVQPPSSIMSGVKRPRQSDSESMRSGGNYDHHRSPNPAGSGVSVNVSHGDGPGGASSVTVTTEGRSGTRPHPAPLSEQMSPPSSYGHPGAPRHRPFHDPHDTEPPRHLSSRMVPLSNPSLETDYGYPDERSDRYGVPHSGGGRPGDRPSLARFAAARSPQTSSSYLASGSDRSTLPTLSTFPSTSSSSQSFSGTTPFASHAYDQEYDEPRNKMARSSMGAPGSNYMITPGPGGNEPSSFPVRKLAATKNRTCSNCAAPHDAKFRRGPNGPGTLCDRCGSRWKKFKEQESAAKQGQSGDSNSASVSASASAAAAARARLSSASSSSQSPMEPGSVQGGRRVSEESPAGGNSGTTSSANISPQDGVDGGVGGQNEAEHRERERSASVDQLIDD